MQTKSIKNPVKIEMCALYLRLSKEDEKGTESASIENQRKILMEYARKNKFVIYDEYVDDGYTGTNLNRPAFQRMLEDAEKGKIQIIMTKDLSRLGRNSGRINMLMDEYFPEHHIRYISVSEGIDTAQRTAVNNIVAPVQNLVNELYAGDISRKIHAAFDVKMQEGACISAFAPYGYYKNPNNKNHLLVDDTAGAVEQRMFLLAKEGYSPSQIATILNKEGVLTPSQYRYQKNLHLSMERFRGATEWKAANINKMLRNEVYLGHMLQGKTYKPSFKSKACYAKPKEEWILVPNTHEPLIDEDTWNIVRKRMQSRTQKREKGFVNIFSGLAFCADCGKNMSTVGTRKKGATANLNCGGYKLGGKKYCSNHTIDYDVLYKAVLAALREQLRLTEQQKQDLLQEMLERTEKQADQEDVKTERRLTVLEQKLEQLFDDKYEGRIAQEQFERLYTKYMEEKTEAESKLKLLQRSRDAKMDFMERKQRYEMFCRLIASYDDLQELNTEILFKLIDRIEVHQGKYIAGKKYQKIDIWFQFQCEPKTMELDFASR